MTPDEKWRILKVYNELKTKLNAYEIQYGMSSSIFYNKFQNGDLPEKEEYFRWRVEYVGLRNIEKSYPWLVEKQNGLD